MESIKETYAEVAGQQTLYMVDLRPHFNAVECPDEVDVGAALKAIFPSEPALVNKPMTGRMQGCFHIEASTAPSDDGITLSRKKRGSTETETVRVPLSPFRAGGPRERQPGTLVTIVDAFTGPARALSGKEFDSVMQNYGRLIMETKPQVNKETNILNGNRMCVVDTANAKNPLPNRIEIDNRSFLIKYKGKRWYCHSCNEEHTGACPYLKRFYEALEHKKSLFVNSLVLGDSTLRLAEHVGVTPDISVMPGATVGQLAQYIEDQPDQEKYLCYYIAAGENDTNVKDETDPFLVAKKIDASLKKLSNIAEKTNQEKGYVFINTSEPRAQKTPIQRFSNLYFTNRVKKIFPQNKISIRKKPQYSERWVEGHPTEQGTRELIEALIPGHIINNDFITTNKLYKGVNTYYVSGCSKCDCRGRFPHVGFCHSCLNSFRENDDFEDYELLVKCKALAFDENSKLDSENENEEERKRRRVSNGSSDGSPEDKILFVDSDDE